MSDPGDEIPDHELDYLEDDDPPAQSWQDAEAEDLGIPRWGPL